MCEPILDLGSESLALTDLCSFRRIFCLIDTLRAIILTSSFRHGGTFLNSTTILVIDCQPRNSR